MFHILILFFLSLGLSAQIILPNEKDNFYNQIQYYEDKSNLITIKDINNQDFKPYTKKFLNFGHTSSTIWLKLELSSRKSKRYVLDYGKYLIDFIDIYYVENNIITRHFSTGNKKANTTKAFRNSTFAFPLDLYKNEEVTLFIKLKSSKVINIPLKIKDRKSFQKKTFFNYLFISAFYTTLLIALFYTIILYVITMKKIFAVYMGYLFSNIIAWFIFSGLSSCFLLLNHPTTNQVLLYIAMYFFHLFFVMFSFEILKIESSLRRTVTLIKIFSYYLLPIAIVFSIIGILLQRPDIEMYAAMSHLYTITFTMFAILLIGILKIIKKDKISVFFSIFWIIKTLFLFIYFVNVKYTFFDVGIAILALKLSIILESLCIPMILGYRLKLYERKSERLKKLYREQKRLSLENYRLSSNASLVNIIAHQLKQPLNNFNSIALNIETKFSANKLDKEYLNSKLTEIELQTEYMSDTINTFTNYFHPNKKKEYFYIYDTLIECLNLLSLSLSSKKIKYSIRCTQKTIKTCGYKKEYIQALLILINNAIEALENDKKIIKFYIYKNKNNKAVFTIKNNGKTIPKELSEKIFEPDFTTKGDKHGLGLFLAKRIIESMNKKIEHKPIRNGAKFNIIG